MADRVRVSGVRPREGLAPGGWSVHGVVQNLFRVGRHLLRSADHRALRTRAFDEWNVVTCAL